MTKASIKLPKFVERIGQRYVLAVPGKRRLDLGNSLAHVRAVHKEALALARGTIASLTPAAEHALFDANIDKSGGLLACWPWRGEVDKDGYGYVGRDRTHRIAYAREAGMELQVGDVVMHTCDNPTCCNPRHLALGTQLQNIADRVSKGRSAIGEANGRAKLTAEQVLQVFNSDEPIEDLAIRYSVTEACIRDVKSGRNWSWLTDSYSKLWNRTT